MIGDMNMKYQKVIALMMLAACVSFAGCSDYKDSYNAFCHVKSFTDERDPVINHTVKYEVDL